MSKGLMNEIGFLIISVIIALGVVFCMVPNSSLLRAYGQNIAANYSGGDSVDYGSNAATIAIAKTGHPKINVIQSTIVAEPGDTIALNEYYQAFDANGNNITDKVILTVDGVRIDNMLKLTEIGTTKIKLYVVSPTVSTDAIGYLNVTIQTS